MNAKACPSLLVIATHPIQYQAPLFRSLAASHELDLTVGFLDIPSASRQGAGFGVSFEWDVPLTDGFHWRRFGSAVGDSGSHGPTHRRRWLQPLDDLRSLSPDAVLAMGWNEFGLLQMWFAAKWLGIPLIIRGESNAKRDRPVWKRCLHRLLLALPDRFVAIGSSNREFYRQSGIPDAAIHVGPYFVDNAFFGSRTASLDREAQRAAWALGASDICVLFAGKFEVKKRPLDLIAAVAALPEEMRSRIVILMVGAGPLEEALRASAGQAGLRVVWAGFLNQTEMPKGYAAADFLVLPSDHGETWGLVVNEAMACGVPAIVSSQVGCADDLVRDGHTGLVFPMGDVDALGKAIMTLATDPEKRRRMGEAARDLVTSDYTIERSVKAIVDAVRALTTRTGRGQGNEASPHSCDLGQ